MPITIAHEMGHGVGLRHYENETTMVMYRWFDYGKNELSSSDADAFD